MTRPALEGKAAVVFRAVSWSAVAMAGSSILGLARSMVLARLLDAEAFGLIGLASVVTGAVAATTNFNIGLALVDRDLTQAEDSNRTINAFWTFELCRCAMTTALLLLLAYPSGVFMKESRLAGILAVVAFVPFISGFANIGLVLERKALNFDLLSKHRLLSEAVNLGVTIAIGLIWHNVWVLVASQLAAGVLSVVFSYSMHPYRPRWAFDWDQLRGSRRFAGNLFILGFLTFFTTQFDNFAVGRYLGVAELGPYLLAYRIAMLPVDIYGQVLVPVLFPTVARLRDDVPRVLPMIRDNIIIVAAFMATVGLPLALASREVVSLVYGGKWPTLPGLLEWCVWIAVCRGLALSLSPFLLGLNRSGLDAAGKVVEVCIFVPTTLYLVTQYGAKGAAAAGIVSYTVALVFRLIALSSAVPGMASLLVRGPLMPILAILGVGFWQAMQHRSSGPGEWLVATAYSAAAAAAGFLFVPRFRQYLTFVTRYVRRFAPLAR